MADLPQQTELRTCSGTCGRALPHTEDYFYSDGESLRAKCKDCYNARITERRHERRAVSDFDLATAIADGGDVLASFGSPIERECAAAVARAGSVAEAAESLKITPAQLRAHLSELQRRAAKRGHAPGSDMTATTPPGYHVKGVSTHYQLGVDDKGNTVRIPTTQWVKTSVDQEHKAAALLDAMAHLADAWTGLADPVAPPAQLDEDLLAVYPMGDPHLGMYAWAEETGNDFDLSIAERNLVAAVDHLVALAPPAKQALIINLGDFFHADNSTNQTARGHHALDVDTRWAKVLRVGIRTMRRCIDRALEKHERVRVICEIGNHDDHSAIMLALCLAQYYEREPRVEIDTSPAKFHWYRFGRCLIGVTHGDTARHSDLPGVMACDRPQDWGETLHRHWYCGHVHHDSLKEFHGVTVETLRTLAPGDSWHRSKGYRSGQDMKLDTWHREDGCINRHRVGIRQVWAAAQAQ